MVFGNKPDLKLEGVYTALVTPFSGEGVDFDALTKLVEEQVAAGIDGLVPCGTTGECPTLSHDEHDKVIEHIVKVVAGRVPVIAGAGSNCTAEAVRLTVKAKECGVTAVLQVNPYYNKPNQQGLFEHFSAIAVAGLPIVLYNIPGRTGITMSPETVAKLYRDVPEIVAIKEATGSVDQTAEIASLCDITILSGDDSLTLPLISCGARGVISVASNIIPKVMLEITHKALKNNMNDARTILLKHFSFFKVMFSETNPQPIKYAMEKTKKIPSGALRLPLVECSGETKAKVDAMLREHKLI
uniref:4-hydroxy-tetrahydrodipicolinate synthase n=1 Tax=Hematodinium sp. SG-2015 TaxID=1649283 RepID=A0A0F6Y5N2_9DINO|nr:DapA [Hematodinium sp. SG-2015]